MIIGIGTDLTQISRIESSLARLGERFARRILAEQELSEFHASSKQVNFLAKRFAVKEAAGKALGTGIGQGVSWHDITVAHSELGAPLLQLSGAALAHADSQGVNNLQLSISDEAGLAMAFVVLSRDCSGS